MMKIHQARIWSECNERKYLETSAVRIRPYTNSGRKQRPLRALLVVMDLDLRYDENSSSPYMERVQRAHN